MSSTAVLRQTVASIVGERCPDLAAAVDPLVAWLELVAKWNRKIDLTAARGDEALAELGVLDATVLASNVAREGSHGRGVVDVGTGFGAPGLAFALLRADLDVTLVEPLGKRASFLRMCIGALGVQSRVRVVESTGEALAETGATFDAATSRATLAPADWLALGDRLAPTGDVALLLAREEPPSHPTRRLAWSVDYATRAHAPRRAVGLSTRG